MRRILAAAGVLLGIFHVWLFADQLLNGRLADPAVLVRWAVSGGLGWLLFGAWRGAARLGSRKTVAIWLLAALLHAPAVAKRLDSPAELAFPDVVATLVKVTLGAGVVLLFSLLGRIRRRDPRVSLTMAFVDLRTDGPLGAGVWRIWSARPPPLA